MKKVSLGLAVAALALFTFPSCKKDWVCTCENLGPLNRQNHNIDNANPSDARSACKSQESQYRNLGFATATCTLN